MYYRVAAQVDAAPTWQWKSSVLSELATLFQFLRLLGALPHNQLRVFSSSSRQGLLGGGSIPLWRSWVNYRAHDTFW